MTQEVIKNIIFAVALAAFAFFTGRQTKEQEVIGKIKDYEVELMSDSLKLEIVKLKHKQQLDKIHYEINQKITTIDNADPVELDSIWNTYGF